MLNVPRERLLRYQQKLQWIIERIENLPPLDENDKNFIFHVDSLFYRLQTSIDGIMDIVAMLCKDLGEEVVDDYNNLDNLHRKAIFDADFTEQLKRMNGLRNVLVHRYNHVDSQLVLKNRAEIIASIWRFLEIVEHVLE